MRISLSWIKEFIDLEKSAQEIADTLTLLGVEVDGISSSELNFSGVVVAEVLDAIPHPEAERLRIATVNSGAETLQVVCAAPNCRSGMKTAFAPIGAELATEDKRIKIKKGKLRGVESFGMLCAADELGIGEKVDGIVEFESHLKPGTPLETLYGDTILEISLTPNLGHCQSHLGIARELGAAYNTNYKLPTLPAPPGSDFHTSDFVKVSVYDQKLCTRYACLALDNVTVGASPDWLRTRLESVGIRSINNVVDVTNYVMLELGQPMHAFDLDKLQGGEIEVKEADKETKLKTLDEEERVLKEGTLLICDASGPIAVAGVIGGEETKTVETTTRVLLEAAHFNPNAVRFGSRKNNIRTDSSSRFERDTDPSMIPFALKRAASLIQELCGANVAQDIIDENSPSKPHAIRCRPHRLNQLLGTNLSISECESIFKRLDMKVEKNDDETLKLTVPLYRNDLREEIDLVEEIGRIHGYNNIKQASPLYKGSDLPEDPFISLENQVRDALAHERLQELLTCDLISPQEAEIVGGHHIGVKAPSSVDQSLLRRQLLPGLLTVIKHNQNLGNGSVCGFEIGHVHDEREERHVAIITNTDFFDLKGIVERLFAHYSKTMRVEKSNEAYLHPKRQAAIESGFLGEVHPGVLNKQDIEGKVYYAEFKLKVLFEQHLEIRKMEALPLYPGTERDWTVTIGKASPAQTLLDSVAEIPSRLLKGVEIVSVYESAELGAQRNVTLRFHYRDDKKTIDSERVEKEHSRIIASVQKNFS